MYCISVLSTQLTSNPMIHKFQLVPSRRIAVGSYLFSLKRHNWRRSNGQIGGGHDAFRDRDRDCGVPMNAFTVLVGVDK